MKESQVAMKILNIDHLGIVAGIIDEMELVEEVNKIVGTKIKETLTPGQVIKAMILTKSWKYHQIKEIEYLEKPEYKTAGRPSKLTEPSQIKYQVKGQIETRKEVIEAEKIKAGRFILATNILDKNELSDEQVLEEYKAQQSNERGFRFLKDPLFFTSSVFVKTPERVESIAMIMGLCLLVYNLAQRKLRQELAKFDDGIRNQVNKITNKPTMRWVFQMFQAVHLVIINGQKQMSNLTEEREKIVRYLGKSCSKYYLII